MKIGKEVKIEKIGDTIYVEGKGGIQKARILGVKKIGDTIEVGTERGEETIKKMIEGVSKGYKSKRKINGVGYKARVEGSEIKLSVGYKDEKAVEIPKTVTVKVEGNVIVGKGDMKEELNQLMSNIEDVRPGRKDKYKGKGIKRV